MRIANPTGTTLEELLPRLQQNYPSAEIKKIWIFPAYINIPMENFRLWVRRRNNGKLFTDFQPPARYTIPAMIIMIIVLSVLITMLRRVPTLGGLGWLPVFITLLIVKGIFKSKNKALLDRFDADVARAAEGPVGGSIF